MVNPGAVVQAAIQAALVGGIVWVVIRVTTHWWGSRLWHGNARKLPDLIVLAGDGKGEAIKDLVKGGSDINVRGPKGQTPLMVAAINKHLETVAMLLELGARTDLADAKGKTAVKWAGTSEIRAMIEASRCD